MKYYIKVITGFRAEQKYTISSEEAHKAYYLFNNPEKRGVFNNGVALIGKNIQGIEPDYNETMGWNPTYELGDDDWAEIRSQGVDRKMRDILFDAKKVSEVIDFKPELLSLPLEEAKNKELI